MNITTAENDIKILFKEIGLNKFDIELYGNIYDGRYTITLSKGLEYNRLVTDSYNEFIKNNIIPIIDNILQSKYVNDIRGEYKEVVCKLESDLSEANEKIQKLEQYKTYYEMAYTLEHGKVANITFPVQMQNPK